MGPIAGDTAIPNRFEWKERSRIMADNIEKQQIQQINDFKKRYPLTVINLGVDLGSYTYWKRAVFHMHACHLDVNEIGWPTKLLQMGHKLFQQMTLS